MVAELLSSELFTPSPLWHHLGTQCHSLQGMAAIEAVIMADHGSVP